MKTKIQRKPPAGPEGTVWFGGPVDRFKVTLRIFGDQLDLDQISAQLGCPPTVAERKWARLSRSGDARYPPKGRWLLTIESKDCGEDRDVEDVVKMLLERLPSDREFWAALTSTYRVDIFCGIFMNASNRGFGISPATSKLLADRNLEIGFDLYFDPPA